MAQMGTAYAHDCWWVRKTLVDIDLLVICTCAQLCLVFGKVQLLDFLHMLASFKLTN